MPVSGAAAPGWRSWWLRRCFSTAGGTNAICGFLLLSIGCNAGFAIALIRGEKNQRFWILLVGLGFNLFLLGYFKYASFVAANVSALFDLDWQVEPMPLPLGISFFTFQKIAFLIDTYIGGVVSFNLLHYSLFVTFFPQLIAGPIVRHNEIIPQFRHLPRTPRASDFAIGGSIFAIGLFKKVCLADLSAPWVDPVFAAAKSGATVSFVDAWVAAFAYSFQLYFDFSGYTDMAIGLARLFGIVLPINFYSPYKSVNIIEFCGAGTSRCRGFCATSSTYRWAEIAMVRRAATPTLGQRCCSADCGTGRPGHLCFGVACTG